MTGSHPTLPGFQNLAGQHCSSTVLRAVLAYDGLEISEPLAFGLGSGLGFFYNVEPEGSPTRRFNGRAPDLEGNFYALAGQPMGWAGSWKPELIARALASGRPVLAQTDIYPIPYYDDAHFIGHGLAVVGLEGDHLITADIAASAFSRMPLASFHEAVAHAYWPLLAPYRYGAAPRLEALDLTRMAPQAVQKTVRYMLTPPSAQEGVAGLMMMADDLPNWRDLPDLTWAARFAYQAIEKRGTGGGGFRRLYRDFLAEASAYLPAVDETVLDGLTRAAELWTALAGEFKALAFGAEPGALARCRDYSLEIAALERSLFERLAA